MTNLILFAAEQDQVSWPDVAMMGIMAFFMLGILYLFFR